MLARGSLRSVLEAAVADCGAKAEEKKMQVQLACPAELTASVNASLLEQAVVNLIENAIAYSPPGQTVEVSGLAGEREIEIRVRDHGCGISREHLPRIFERFYRVDKSRSRDSGGTGLGLAIVKHIVQIHGGRTAVESIPGRRQHLLHFLAEVTLRIVNQPVLHSRLSLRERTPASRSERRQLLTRPSCQDKHGVVIHYFTWVKSSIALAFSPIFP